MSIVYSQSTGRIIVRSSERTIATLGVGYAGHASGVNNPQMEYAKGEGPVPRGSYYLREREHESFASPAFFLEPTEATQTILKRYGRAGFWVHGDNARRDRSASRGCIVAGLAIRLAIRRYIAAGHKLLTVEQ